MESQNINFISIDSELKKFSSSLLESPAPASTTHRRPVKFRQQKQKKNLLAKSVVYKYTHRQVAHLKLQLTGVKTKTKYTIFCKFHLIFKPDVIFATEHCGLMPYQKSTYFEQAHTIYKLNSWILIIRNIGTKLNTEYTSGKTSLKHRNANHVELIA